MDEWTTRCNVSRCDGGVKGGRKAAYIDTINVANNMLHFFGALDTLGKFSQGQ